MLKALILDLDGTVYNGSDAIPGAAAFVRHARQHGCRALFVTNRSNRPPDVVCRHLQELGMPCAIDDVLTSAQATARHLPPGKAYLIGEEGLVQAMREAGHTLTDTAPDYVVVGLDRGFNYDKLRVACRCIHQGARFIATNPDHALNTGQDISPGTGAIVAAVASGSRTEPQVIGKPERTLVDLALDVLEVSPDQAAMIGDNIETDVAAGAAAGIRTALILTGISTREDLRTAYHHPTWVAEDYNELRDLLQPEFTATHPVDKT